MEDVDEYLRGVDEPKRATLEAIRRTILEIVPDAEQLILYRVPAFRVGGATMPARGVSRSSELLAVHGSVLSQLPDELADYTMTKSAHFSVDRPLPRALVEKLIAVRLQEL